MSVALASLLLCSTPEGATHENTGAMIAALCHQYCQYFSYYLMLIISGYNRYNLMIQTY